MLSIAGTLAAPFPYFGGKANACELVWSLFGDPDNYVEPFAGSAAMLLGRPTPGKVETINDFDGFVANFWRAVAVDPEAVARWADWPTNEADLFARHGWLVRQKDALRDRLDDPDYYDAKIAGWWCWGACNWIGSGWCAGTGPWVWNGARLVDSRQLPHLGDSGQGINRKLPHLGDSGQGINRKLPHLGDSGRGINRQLPHLGDSATKIMASCAGDRYQFILEWFEALRFRLRNVRVACGDWSRVLTESVTVRHGDTAVFLDPPYDRGSMDYGAGGMGLGISAQVRAWAAAAGTDPRLRIVLCGHAGEHDELCGKGWVAHQWTARKGYASTEEALANSASETVWASPHCRPLAGQQGGLFA